MIFFVDFKYMYSHFFRTIRAIFFNLLVWYLIASVAEFLVPGFVRLYLSLWNWLWIVVIFGIAYLLLTYYEFRE